MKETPTESRQKSDESWKSFIRKLILFYLIVGICVWLLGFIPWDKIA